MALARSGPNANVIAMAHLLRRVMLMLLAFAVIGGTTTQLARAARHAASVPCEMTAMPAAATADDHAVSPCKGMAPDCLKPDGLKPDCLKQMCCAADALLAQPFATAPPAIRMGVTEYWPARSRLAETLRAPDALPPRTT